MDRLGLKTAFFALMMFAACIAVAACGGSSAPEQSQPASQTGRADAQGGQADDEDPGADKKDGATQSNSVSQSSDGDSTNQSSSVVQRSGSGSSSSHSTSSGGGVQTLTGTGPTTVSFNVEKPSRLSWTNAQGKAFSARGAGLSIDSREGRGEVSLDAGRYDDVKVRGSTWTIVIRPR
jgi:hypothetical protein